MTLEEVHRGLADDGQGQQQRLPRSTRRRRVLVADGDRMTRTLARTLPERDGYDVLEAQNSREAITLALGHPTGSPLQDLLMLDVEAIRR